MIVDDQHGRVTYATFGIGPQVLSAIRADQITFAADQQPYLEGYLPIVLLTQYHLYGIVPDRGKLISTVPCSSPNRTLRASSSSSVKASAETKSLYLAGSCAARSFQQRGESGTGELCLWEEAPCTTARDHASEVLTIMARCQHHRGWVIRAPEAEGNLEPIDVWKPYVQQHDRRAQRPSRGER